MRPTRPLLAAVVATLAVLAPIGRANAQDVTAETAPDPLITAPIRDAGDTTATPSGPNVEIAKRFYDAFTSGDMNTLQSLYDPQVKWQDAITSFDDRAGTMGMWRALAANPVKVQLPDRERAGRRGRRQLARRL